MPLSPKTQKYVWGLFAGRCAICHENLVHEGSGGERSLLGEIAHIVGDKPGAARGLSTLTAAERDHPDNLLLLCQKNHKIIDDHPEQYPVERLHEMRKAHLAWLRDHLEKSEPWQLDVSAFAYLNVPRLSEYAALNGYKIRHGEIPPGVALNDLGWDLNRVMAAFKATLENIAISSVPVDRIGFAHEGYIGQIVRFERLRFRTKNVPQHTPPLGADLRFTGDLSNDPHIYRKFERWMLVLNINPKWITTDTALGLFRPSNGASVFTGFGRITSVDLENGVMTATAFAVGLPQPLFDIFEREPPPWGERVNFDALKDKLSIARGTVWGGKLEHCDFCGKPFDDEPYMIDGPKRLGGPWGCMCGQCYSKARLPLGIGKGQLFERRGGRWVLVGGYPDTGGDEEGI